MNVGQYILTAALRGYRLFISPVLTALFNPLGFGCRFHPTCSCYATSAIETHGAFKGALLAAWRICRCHPFGGSGHDPVPSTFRFAFRRKGAPGPTPVA